MNEKPPLVIETKDLTKDYGNHEVVVHALRGVSLRMERGEFSAIAGPSGSGKSTLLNILGGLDRPTEGRVLFEGRDISNLSATEMSRLRRERIGFVFQHYNLVPVFTALENAEYVLMLQGVAQDERKERVLRLFQEVGLDDLESRFPHELSGGQQQRVAIVRAIAPEPAIVLADEPTANVDSRSAGRLLDLMRRLNEEKGATFLFSTHDPLVMNRSRRLILLRDGQVADDGPPDKVLRE
ncbi:MAG: ABC transporter ATP-binding protein [Candidatus Eisenbacteria bacterium]